MNSTVATAYVEPVVKTLRVRASPARAFEVFTADMGRWWMRSHSINPSGSPQADVVIEPRAGGRWYERGEDGSECDWGRVVSWEPPARMVLAWQISAQWQFDPELYTEVEVRFRALDAEHTEVTLEHRLLENYGEAAAGLRQGVDSPNGWGALLAEFAKVVQA